MTDEPREVFLIRVWIAHRNLPVDNIVQVDSDVTGRAWVLENKLRQEDARVRAMYEPGMGTGGRATPGGCESSRNVRRGNP